MPNQYIEQFDTHPDKDTDPRTAILACIDAIQTERAKSYKDATDKNVDGNQGYEFFRWHWKNPDAWSVVNANDLRRDHKQLGYVKEDLERLAKPSDGTVAIAAIKGVLGSYFAKQFIYGSPTRLCVGNIDLPVPGKVHNQTSQAVREFYNHVCQHVSKLATSESGAEKRESDDESEVTASSRHG